MNEHRVIALLGKQDVPTDAVEEYCSYLGQALRAHGFAPEIVRVPWPERGWPLALHELDAQANSWHGCWVLLQYTALSWSSRGFPHRFLQVIKVLGRRRARIGIVYHDPEPNRGTRMIDKLRKRVQLWTMRRSLRASELAIFTVPVEKVSWAVPKDHKAVFIPVGANLPVPGEPPQEGRVSADRPLTIAVFGITGGAAGLEEMSRILEATRCAAKHVSRLRLIVLGRNSELAETSLRPALRELPVELQTLGILPPAEVARALQASDVLFFVRGPISTGRTTAITGVACGLPIIAYPGPLTSSPITKAGVALVDQEDQAGLGAALVRILTDQNYRATLAEQSRLAHQQHFAWDVIAARYAEHLKDTLA